MSVNYSEIYSLFLSSIKDYKIDRLFKDNDDEGKQAEVYMKPFLIKGLVNFNNCKKNLENRDDTDQVFNDDLSTAEKVILSNLMLIEWLTKEVNDILQMKLHLQDSDFKTFSSAQNLREKSVHLNNTREVVDKQITQYGYNNLDWSNL